MDEASIQASLDLYKSQLLQVDEALQSGDSNNEDLKKLRADLQELVSLTEESLLSLKKSNLLASLEQHEVGETTQSSQSQKDTSSSFDDEYAAFQAALGEDISQTQSTSQCHNVHKSNPKDVTNSRSKIESASHSHKDSLSDSVCNDSSMEECDTSLNVNSEGNLSADLECIIGTKCRAPYTHEWGSMSYHNAIISGIEKPDHEDSQYKVTVMFCYPTHTSMLPCKYQLEGSCRFSDEKCKFSHGHVVNVEDLKEFVDPDHSSLALDTGCLAKYEDDLWYRATVVGVNEDHTYTVMFDSYNETLTIDIGSILPLDPSSKGADDGDESSENEDDSSKQSLMRLSDEDDDEDDLPVFLYKPPRTLNAIGEWESHTKGIGSKLMAKMGFIIGQGLGKNGQGRTEPVPIQLLPQGKSLDKIMELKEIAGERDLFDVMKKKERQKKAQEKKMASGYHKEKAQEINVFDFINKKLRGKKGNLKDLIPKEHSKNLSRHHKQISENDLSSKSDRTLNVQLLKTDEEIKNVQKELLRLKQSLSRNESRDKGMAVRVKQKINSMEEYLQKLQTSERALTQHRQKRTNHKKLTIF